MLCCGSTWQPTEVRRFVEGFRTSTRVARVVTDQGNAFLKGIGNPAGVDSLACELVCAELANWFGLRTPEFCIISVQGIDIPMADNGNVHYGPAFVSKEMEGTTGDGGNFLLSKLRDKSAPARLVVFDTWVRNADRYPPQDPLQPMLDNRDNLFFTPGGKKFDLVALDHSHCFVETTLGDELGQDHLLDDDRVYGLFPEFQPFMETSAVASAIAQLKNINPDVVSEIMASLPIEWGVTKAQRTDWSNLIVGRAGVVAEYIEEALTNQAALVGL